MKNWPVTKAFTGVLALLCCMLPLRASADTWLWAWDRNEDLRWLPSHIGVAYFAVQFDARGSSLTLQPRRPILRAPAANALLPVLHIEAFHTAHPATMDAQAVALWADRLADTINRLGTARVQIDFEARASQRQFYHDVLLALREKLPPAFKLSITALASWCGDPAWLAALPVDEIVPMYFRMGPAERDLWRQRLLHAEQLPRVCRGAAGLSIDELHALSGGGALLPGLSAGGRSIYLFAPRAWRPSMLEDFMEMARDDLVLSR